MLQRITVMKGSAVSGEKSADKAAVSGTGSVPSRIPVIIAVSSTANATAAIGAKLLPLPAGFVLYRFILWHIRRASRRITAYMCVI